MENKKKTDWWFSFENRYSGLVALLSREPISASVKTSYPLCSLGLRSPGSPAGRCPYSLLGAWDPGPQTPSLPAWGASSPQCCLILTLILLLLEIILTTLETSGSVAKCRLFSKARYTCTLIKEDVIHLSLRLIRPA